MTEADLEALAHADTLLDEAEDALMNDKPGKADRIVRKVQRARLAAIKAEADTAGRLELLMAYVFTAAATEDHRRVAWAVRQAVPCSPSEEQLADLRDYWEDSAWVLGRGDLPFPEPPGEAERPSGPLLGQMSFLFVEQGGNA